MIKEYYIYCFEGGIKHYITHPYYTTILSIDIDKANIYEEKTAIKACCLAHALFNRHFYKERVL